MCMLSDMTHRKMSREESLARAHAANRRKRLERLADELRENGWMVVPPEENTGHQPQQQPRKAA